MGAGKTIEEEPSWVVVNMLLAFLVISVFTEHFMEWIHELLEKRHSEGIKNNVGANGINVYKKISK